MEVKGKLSEKAYRDYTLVLEALDGNQKAYSQLMNSYRDSLYFLMLKMTNEPYYAEDLTIEAFGKAFKCLSQYSPDYAFSTWLFKIASNNCIDFLRKQRNNTISIDNSYNLNSEESSNIFELPCESAAPDASIIEKQKNIFLRELVNNLKPKYKHIVELRYFEEQSIEEISEVLNLPTGTVKAQLFRARELLYKMIKGTEITI